MNGEIPFEIQHVRDRLDRDYNGLIEGTGSNETERLVNFRSKALAAFAIHNITGCTLQESAKAIVDGGADGGIDAVYISTTGTDLVIVQSKFMTNGKGSPSLGDVTKFREGVENLMSGQFDGFQVSESFRTRLPSIRACIEKTGVRVQVVLTYSGINQVEEEQTRVLERLERHFLDEKDDFSVRSYNLTSVHDWLSGAQDFPGVDVELTLHHPARMTTPAPFEMHYGLVELQHLASLYATHGKTLVTANIREYKGPTEVNDQILQTLSETPQHFPYFNNGLTAYCSRAQIPTVDRANTERKRLNLTGFCVVNGAQTLGSINQSAMGVTPLEGFAFIKIISLERCENEREFAEQITRATNFQNQVNLRDFAALDPEQIRIANHLELSGIHYHYRDSANTPDGDEENFDFNEAMLSLACLEPSFTYRTEQNVQMQDFLCAFALSNRNPLRSDEKVYPDTEAYPSRYRRIFNPNRSARTVWRSVQTKRAVIARMQENTKDSQGQRKAFFEHARWLVLNLVFLRLKLELGDTLRLSADEIQTIRRETDTIAEALWGTVEHDNRHFKTVFSSVTDCVRLKAATLAALSRSR